MAKYVVVKINVLSGDFEITDENGNPASTNAPDGVNKKPLSGPALGQIDDMQSFISMRTSASPGCRWIIINGVPYWVCD